MELKKLPYDLTICKIREASAVKPESDFYFLQKTDEEISLVCLSQDTPSETIEREDGWKAFRIQGVLDFSMVGILSELSAILAEQDIGIFAVSTYNTDYILVKEHNFQRALEALRTRGYTIL